MGPQKILLQISSWKAVRECMILKSALWIETMPSGQKESTSKTQNIPLKYLLDKRGRGVEVEMHEGRTWFKIVLNRDELVLGPEILLGSILNWQVDVVAPNRN